MDGFNRLKAIKELRELKKSRPKLGEDKKPKNLDFFPDKVTGENTQKNGPILENQKNKEKTEAVAAATIGRPKLGENKRSATKVYLSKSEKIFIKNEIKMNLSSGIRKIIDSFFNLKKREKEQVLVLKHLVDDLKKIYDGAAKILEQNKHNYKSEDFLSQNALIEKRRKNLRQLYYYFKIENIDEIGEYFSKEDFDFFKRLIS